MFEVILIDQDGGDMTWLATCDTPEEAREAREEYKANHMPKNKEIIRIIFSLE